MSLNARMISNAMTAEPELEPRSDQDRELEVLLTQGFRFALSLTHDRSRAEDLLQDAWLSILNGRRPRHLGYLRQTIRNRFYDQERRSRLVRFEALNAAENESAPGSESLPDHVERRDVERALGVLRPRERETLFLATVEGYSVREIARETGQAQGTVASLLRRSKSKVRQWLQAPVKEARQ